MTIGFKNLESKRLLLRQLEITDSKAVLKLRSDPVVNKYLDRKPMKSLSEASDFIKKINDGVTAGEWLYWGITLKNQPDLIGTICLWQFSDQPFKAELGYELQPAFQGNGYMNEAMQIIIHYGVQVLGLDALEAVTHKDNLTSVHLLVKNGFASAGELEEKDMILFRLQN